MRRRLALVFLVLLPSGCTGSPPPPPEPLPSPSPIRADLAFADAVARLGTETYTYKTVYIPTGGVQNSSGAVDPAAGRSKLKTWVSATGTSVFGVLDVLRADGRLWIQRGELDRDAGNRWESIPAAKIRPGGNLAQLMSNDPSGLAEYAKSARDVKRVDARRFTGVLDISASSTVLQEAYRFAQGVDLMSIPFEAVLDEQGRVVEFTMRLTAKTPAKLLFSDFGKPLALDKPPSKTAPQVDPVVIDRLNRFGGLRI